MDYKKVIKSIALVSIIVFQILLTFFPSKEIGIFFAVLIFGIFLWFTYIKSYDSMNFALLYFLIMICNFLPYLRFWPMPAGFLVFIILQTLFPNLRKKAKWFKFGKYNSKNVVYLIITIVISTGILVLWYLITLPNLNPMVTALQDKPKIVIIISIIGFAIINAVVEESIFDGICYRAMEEHFKIPIIFIGIQALSYSVSHFHGIPNGYIGILLSFVYGGLMLGGLRYLSKGLVFPIIAHIFADLTIAILAFSSIGMIID